MQNMQRRNPNENDSWFKGKPQYYNCKKFEYLAKDSMFINT